MNVNEQKSLLKRVLPAVIFVGVSTAVIYVTLRAPPFLNSTESNRLASKLLDTTSWIVVHEHEGQNGRVEAALLGQHNHEPLKQLLNITTGTSAVPSGDGIALHGIASHIRFSIYLFPAGDPTSTLVGIEYMSRKQTVLSDTPYQEFVAFFARAAATQKAAQLHSHAAENR